MHSRRRRKLRQKAPRSFWKFIAAALRMAFERIAGNALQAVALQPVFRLQMPDAGFDRRAPLHPSPQLPRCPTSLPPVHAHSYRAFIIVAAITHARAG
jgi:hypothetical protein